MRGQASDIGRRRFWRFSGPQSGSAVRSEGDLPESAPTTLMKDYLFESALVSHVAPILSPGFEESVRNLSEGAVPYGLHKLLEDIFARLSNSLEPFQG
jgi:hypothetical protein